MKLAAFSAAKGGVGMRPHKILGGCRLYVTPLGSEFSTLGVGLSVGAQAGCA